MSSGRPDDYYAGGPHRSRHTGRSSVDSTGSPIDPASGQPFYPAGARASPYPPHGQRYPASSSSGPYALHPAPYAPAQSYAHNYAQPSAYSSAGAYPSYQGPTHDGHPIVPSQDYNHHDMPVASQSSYYPQTSAYTSSQSGYAYGSSSATQVQAVTPPPVSPIACQQCGTTFTRRHDLGRHMDSHHGDASHHCPYCTKSYARADSLKRHIDSPCPGAPKKDASSSKKNASG